MHRWAAAAAVLLMILVACSSTSSSTSTSSPATATSASAGPSCVNRTEFDADIQSAQDHVTSAVAAATALNFGTAQEELEKAGAAIQHAADIAGEVSPDLKNELQSASDSVNKAVTDVQNRDGGATVTDLGDAGTALTQASADADNFFC